MTLAAAGVLLPAWVTVRLFAATPVEAVTVTSRVPWVLRGPAGSRAVPAGTAVRFERVGASVRARWPGGQGLAASWRPEGRGPWRLWAGRQHRVVAGRLTLAGRGREVTPLACVALEAFVSGALAAEEPADAPPAAQAALAMCIRTFATRAAAAPRHAEASLCDATHCLRFATASGESRPQRAAVRETSGQVVAWRQRPALTVWHAACGGHTVPAEVAFGGAALPYLRGAPDRRREGGDWCRAAPGGGPWRVTASREVVAAALAEAGLWPRGARLEAVIVAEAGAGGAVGAVRLTGGVTRVVPGRDFWHALGPRLGWRGLRSLAFTLTPSPAGWVATGRGLGHGVGLCQGGAAARARAGFDARAILAAYFPGTRLVRGRPTGRVPPW
ncbi:MAG: SpoIID/LytB domain-containing protein [Candidatus Sericytochromatia bacterium]|nr:SpoIID/LytB domain-containing protein [Candidatus Sericytochromatia bacterium]